MQGVKHFVQRFLQQNFQNENCCPPVMQRSVAEKIRVFDREVRVSW